MLTLAEEWLLEGEARGESKTKIETVENLLKIGMDWSLIEQVTGVDQRRLQTLKQQLAQLTQARKPQAIEQNAG